MYWLYSWTKRFRIQRGQQYVESSICVGGTDSIWKVGEMMVQEIVSYSNVNYGAQQSIKGHVPRIPWGSAPTGRWALTIQHADSGGAVEKLLWAEYNFVVRCKMEEGEWTTFQHCDRMVKRLELREICISYLQIWQHLQHSFLFQIFTRLMRKVYKVFTKCFQKYTQQSVINKTDFSKIQLYYFNFLFFH